MKRLYESLLDEHWHNHRQMAFLAGPRQVGKTTSAQTVVAATHHFYFNWDIQDHRRLIIRGPAAVAEHCGFDTLTEQKPVVVFDEIHKYGKWKLFLKGFFDAYENKQHTIVTGSGRLNVYKRSSDSLMGRYFLYRMHPLSVAELLTPSISEKEIRRPRKISPEDFRRLLHFGGFPEPFLKANQRFYNRWHRLRVDQLFYEDLRDLTRIQEIAQVEMLAETVGYQTGQLVNYSKLATAVNVSVDTVRRWISTLESLYFCFCIRPWFRNIPKSLRKQPKIYLWDWSIVKDTGARNENFIACHLLKAVHWWTDIGLGHYQLYFIRDKEKREVDFLVTRNDQPWFLAEVKTSGKTRLSKALVTFQQKTGAEHAFQVVFDSDYVNKDCFAVNIPVITPVSTFLSQLV